jgi:hypothetical protein
VTVVAAVPAADTAVPSCATAEPPPFTVPLELRRRRDGQAGEVGHGGCRQGERAFAVVGHPGAAQRGTVRQGHGESDGIVAVLEQVGGIAQRDVSRAG